MACPPGIKVFFQEGCQRAEAVARNMCQRFCFLKELVEVSKGRLRSNPRLPAAFAFQPLLLQSSLTAASPQQAVESACSLAWVLVCQSKRPKKVREQADLPTTVCIQPFHLGARSQKQKAVTSKN